MDDLILLNKPMNMLSQFSAEGQKPGISELISAPGYRVAGRLDADSEGLLVLTSYGHLQAYLTSPKRKTWKYYYVQVEGVVSEQAIRCLQVGIQLNDGPTLPARVRVIDPPALWDRSPPVRYRANIPTSWLEIGLQEGRNRQIRRMTAHVGYPTLRLVRFQSGPFRLGDLRPGEYRRLPIPDELKSFAQSSPKLRSPIRGKHKSSARNKS
jgi:23S rRNA pseudouridine2457 synthase